MRGRLRDVDAAGRAHLLRILSWSLMIGMVGGFLGIFGAAQGMWGAGTILLMAFIGWAGSFFFPLILSSVSGRAAQTLYAPSGSSTPKQREYSLAESLVARGMYDEAIAAFEEVIAEDPSDPTPYLRIARIYRDRLTGLDQAAGWFKRALDESSLSAGTATLARRELVELYVSRMGEPGRAAALLARTAEERAGTTEGEWAAEELTRVKAMIAAEAEAEAEAE